MKTIIKILKGYPEFTSIAEKWKSGSGRMRLYVVEEFRAIDQDTNNPSSESPQLKGLFLVQKIQL